MAIPDFFGKLRPYKSVLKRTKPLKELPAELLYVHGLTGEGKRKLLDIESKEHILSDKLLQSAYKMSSGAVAKTRIKEHWASAKPQKAAE